METINRLLLTFLLNAVWQIPLIAVVTFFCDWLLRKTSARIQHILWVCALILSFGLPLFTCYDLSRGLFESQSIQTIDIKHSSNIVSAPILLDTPQSVVTSTIEVNKYLSIILLSLYFLFVSYRSIKLLNAWRQTRIIRNQTFSAKGQERILEIADEYERFFGIKKVQIIYSSLVTAPITAGAFDPLIILPEKLAEETDENILRSAIGHELVHVKRRDYLLNFLYEFIFLPLSFHPVAALVKRRIKETRELSCDEMVTDKLLEPKVYADSLVRLAGSALDLGRTTTMTIGINDADILENRIMRILKRPKITVYRRNLLLISASIFFAAAFIVAATFTLRPVIAQEKPKEDSKLEEKRKAEKEAQRQYLTKIVDDGRGEYKTTLDKKAAENIDLKMRKIEDEVLTQKAEQEMTAKNLADFAKQTKITMTEAIEIATKQQPGTVLEGRLVFVKVGDVNQPFYAIKIASDQEKASDEKVLFISATDGKISDLKLISDHK